MRIEFPRVITKHTFQRYVTEARRKNREFVCSRCGKPFNIGDKIYKFRTKGSRYCCENCFKNMIIDIPDNILDENDERFIERGRWD